MTKYQEINVFGEILDLEIIDNPISELSKNSDERNLKIYFYFDNFKYTGEGITIFQTKNYILTNEFNDIEDKYEYSYCYFYRLFSLHYIILDELLPFKASIVLSDGRTMTINPLYKYDFNKFYLLHHNQKWKNIKSDFALLNKNITEGSYFEKTIIWFTLAKLSYTNNEEFMNLFNSVENLTRDKFGNYSETNKIKDVLVDLGFTNEESKYIIKVRNKILHGHSFSLEFSFEMNAIKLKLAENLKKVIIKKIKLLNIIGLKTKELISDYYVLKNDKTKEIILVEYSDLSKYDSDDINSISEFATYARTDINKLLKESNYNDGEIKYILYCYDYHKRKI